MRSDTFTCTATVAYIEGDLPLLGHQFRALIQALFYSLYPAKIGVGIEWYLLCSYVFYCFAFSTIVLDRIGIIDFTSMFIMN